MCLEHFWRHSNRSWSKWKTSWKHFQVNIETSFLCLWLWSYQWFLDSNPEDEYLSSSFILQIWRAWSAKTNQGKQADRPSHVSWSAPQAGKFIRNMTTKIKVSNLLEKSFCLHDGFTAATFQTIVRLYCTCANDNF